MVKPRNAEAARLEADYLARVKKVLANRGAWETRINETIQAFPALVLAEED